jgi:hypothetical protein
LEEERLRLEEERLKLEEVHRKLKRERAVSRPTKMESSPIMPGYDDDIYGFELRNAQAKEESERLLREEAQYVETIFGVNHQQAITRSA